MSKKLEYFGGVGFGGMPEVGNYEVNTGTEPETITKFTSLTKARAFYDAQEQEKAIWNIRGVADLLECHTYKE